MGRVPGGAGTGRGGGVLKTLGYTAATLGTAWAACFVLGAAWVAWGPLCPFGYWLLMLGSRLAPAGACLLVCALALTTAAAHGRERE